MLHHVIITLFSIIAVITPLLFAIFRRCCCCHRFDATLFFSRCHFFLSLFSLSLRLLFMPLPPRTTPRPRYAMPCRYFRHTLAADTLLLFRYFRCYAFAVFFRYCCCLPAQRIYETHRPRRINTAITLIPLRYYYCFAFSLLLPMLFMLPFTSLFFSMLRCRNVRQ